MSLQFRRGHSKGAGEGHLGYYQLDLSQRARLIHVELTAAACERAVVHLDKRAYGVEPDFGEHGPDVSSPARRPPLH
eukprot:CAMPEP_0196659842 /NCGR_PEP_ID=MMETSP1086-20130531/36818_1 /TAXON_ID=77921 /ORGANISM="Cyanoptyche  gloeocystis , Strain SAG4.97" /LENGTH=76 /DNA_ID=CAMNT_0041993973 /DNA_START=454 /DNA_END=684 /DNA_ORIENTATION=-